MSRKLFTAVIIILAVVAIISIPFFPQELIDQYGDAVKFAPIGFVIVLTVIGVIISSAKRGDAAKTGESRQKYNSISSSSLQEKRQGIVIELKEAEKQFLQHKIDKATFDAISKEKNSALIETEAEIDAQKKKGLPAEELRMAESVSEDKRKILLGLLEQKQFKVHELKIAEASYYRRKIDEDLFQNISSQIKTEMISIESKIKSIQQSEEIGKLKEQLKEGAKEVLKQKNSSEQRNKQEFMSTIEDDIFEQASSDEREEKRR